MGHAPLWYRVIKAAQYLGVEPWDLYERPASWLSMAEAAQAAEGHARIIHAKQAQNGQS